MYHWGMISCETRSNIRRVLSRTSIHQGEVFIGHVYREQYWTLGERGDYVGLGEWRGGSPNALQKEAFGHNDHRFLFASIEQAVEALQPQPVTA